MTEYGNADLVERRLGLTPSVGRKIGAIITFAGSIEYHLERALWKLRKIDPRGTKPDTDSKMTSDLIAMLEKYAALGSKRHQAKTSPPDWSHLVLGFLLHGNA